MTKQNQPKPKQGEEQKNTPRPGQDPEQQGGRNAQGQPSTAPPSQGQPGAPRSDQSESSENKSTTGSDRDTLSGSRNKGS